MGGICAITTGGAAGERGVGSPLGRVAGGAVLVKVRCGVLCGTGVGRRRGGVWVNAGHGEKKRRGTISRARGGVSKGWDVRAARRENLGCGLTVTLQQKKESGNGPVVGYANQAPGGINQP